jgi:uncharacterized repeat protein (TIGR01451 family)
VVTFTVTVTNSGPDLGVGVLANSTTPPGTTFASISASQGTCVTPAAGQSGPVSCTLGTIPAGGSATILLTLNVTATSGQSVSYETTVTSSSSDPNQANNTATRSVMVQVTTPPTITDARKLTEPFRIKLTGLNFQPGAQVFIGSSANPWPDVQCRSSTMLVIRRGRILKEQFPKGVPTRILVVNPDGGEDEFLFTR